MSFSLLNNEIISIHCGIYDREKKNSDENKERRYKKVKNKND